MRSAPMALSRLATVATCVSAIAVASPAHAQLPVPGAWTFVSSPHADLWFHGLAVVGFEGFAPVPLYSRDYVARVHAAKAERGVARTPLDSMAGSLRAGLERDSTFELFHFVPLYFGVSSVPEMLEALNDVARGRRPSDFGSGAVASVLTSRRQRRVLGEFVRALEVEWELFYREYWEETRAANARHIVASQQLWNRTLGPVLDPFLRARQALGGVAFVSPAVGLEGRVFGGRPERPDDHVAAVMLAPSDSLAAALLLVRELCYPLASELTERMQIGVGDRVFAERVSSRAAIRCGAMLLDRHVPNLTARYRELYLAATSEDGRGAEAFRRAFPVDALLLRELREELRAY
ncbi:MAG: hypothetical protein OER90_08865 [Gemmatimonadota bacterium]|nr:hypothetical protein [Gemmatimonadota bacterium]